MFQRNAEDVGRRQRRRNVHSRHFGRRQCLRLLCGGQHREEDDVGGNEAATSAQAWPRRQICRRPRLRVQLARGGRGVSSGSVMGTIAGHLGAMLAGAPRRHQRRQAVSRINTDHQEKEQGEKASASRVRAQALHCFIAHNRTLRRERCPEGLRQFSTRPPPSARG